MDRYPANFNVHNDDTKHHYSTDEIPIKDFSYTTPPVKPKGKSKFILIGVLLVLIVLIGGYFLVKPSPKNNKGLTNQTTKLSEVKPKTNPSSTPSGQPTTYSSTNFSLTVTYPQNWVISDTPSAMSITSPLTNLVADSGKITQSKIVITIGPQGVMPTLLGSQSSTAVLNSDLITYTNPTPAQDAQTYLSFLQYASTTVPGGLDGIYITGNYGYLKGQYVTQADLASIDPLVRVTFEQCINTNCTRQDPLTISSSDWYQSTFSSPLLNIIKSFQFS